MARRGFIDTSTDKRYVRRDTKCRFKESDVGRSLAADRTGRSWPTCRRRSDFLHRAASGEQRYGITRRCDGPRLDAWVISPLVTERHSSG